MSRIEFNGKERDEVVVSLYKKLIDEKGDCFDKLNIVKLDYGYRVRYEKDESGAVISKIMDRGFIGLAPSRIGVESSSDILTCFIYGKKTVGAVIKGESLLLNKSLIESADFNVLMLNIANEKRLSIEWIDGLPTGEVIRKAKTEKTLDDCINNAKTIESLGADLGF